MKPRKIIIHRGIFTSICLLIFLLAPACKRTSDTFNYHCPLKIGVITSLTGKHQTGGREHKLGYDLAAEEINAAGGILGCPVSLVYEDDTSDPNTAALKLKTLAEDPQILLILGAYSSAATLQVAGLANVYQIPLMVPTASSDLITDQGYQWVFRINAPSADYAYGLLNYLDTVGEYTEAANPDGTMSKNISLGIIYEDTLFGESAAVAAATHAIELQIPIIVYKSYKPGTSSYKAVLEALREQNPNVIYLATNSVSDAVTLLQQSKSVLPDALYLGHAGAFVTNNFLYQAGPSAEGMLIAAQWAPDASWQGAAEFAQRFRARYSEETGMRSAQTYTTLYVAKDAIERAFSNNPSLAQNNTQPTKVEQIRAAVRDALNETNLPETIFGPISFDETGQNNHPVVLLKIVNGQFITTYADTN